MSVNVPLSACLEKLAKGTVDIIDKKLKKKKKKKLKILNW